VASARAVTLDVALQQTLERNPLIQQARAEVEAAAGRRLVLRSVAWPDLRIDVFGGAQGGHRAGQPATQPFAFARGAFAQPLFNAAVPAALRRGNIELLIAQQRLNVTIVEQLHTARVAFCTALFNESLTRLGEAQRQRLAANVTSEAARYRGGQSNRAALVAAQALEQEVLPRLQTAESARGAAQLSLTQAMGLPLGPGATLAKPEGELHLQRVVLDVDREAARAIRQRADLQLARLLVRAAAEDQRIAQAGYYPRIDATLIGNYIPVSDVRRDNGGSPQRANDVISSEIRAGGAFTWRVIDNGRVTGAVIQQRAIREANELVLRRLEANLPRELAALANRLNGIGQRQESLGGAAAAGEQIVAAISQNVTQGLATQLELRTAETALLRAQTTSITAAFEQAIALAEWDRATGRYFEFAQNQGR
jgi:outer membrane protein TolC